MFKSGQDVNEDVTEQSSFINIQENELYIHGIC